MNIFLIILGIFIVIFMPLLVIWALNTLFSLTIVYTLSTWFAVFVIGFFIGGSRAVYKNKN